MKNLYLLFIILSILGLTLSDPFIVGLNSQLNQSYFMLPLIGLSFRYYNIEFHTTFFKNLFAYLAIGFTFFALYGFKNLELLSNLIGTVLVGFGFYSLNFSEYLKKYLFKTFIAITTLFSLFYYAGMWDISFVGRATFIKHNENYLAQILNIGLSFSLFYYVTNKEAKIKRRYLIISILHILPIFATISRTGITLMLITIVIFTWGYMSRKFKYFLLVFILLTATIGSTFFDKIVGQSEYLKRYIERTSEAKEDERAELWNISINLAKNNLFTGTGFDRFYDYNWRKSVGLYSEIYDAESGTFTSVMMSVHNSYIDLILIGGIWLLLFFNFIFYYPLRYSLLFINKDNLKLSGFLVIVMLLNAFAFSFTGQGATQKVTWFLIGQCYFIIDSEKQYLT